jgi:pyrimidine deaminase RibD-like protein
MHSRAHAQQPSERRSPTCSSRVSRRLASLVEIAYKEALKGVGNKHRHGAVVLAGGRILAKACNNYKNRYHAEVRALRRIPHDARGTATEIIVVRAMRGRKFGMSRPCPECQKAIREANIRVVYFSTDNEFLGYETYGD